MSRENHEGVLISEDSLDQFLHAFFHHTLPKPQWTHAAHVTLAACLLHKADVPSVLPIVRNAIRSYNLSVGTQNTDTSGYHETLTVFWLRVVAQSLRQLLSVSRLEAARRRRRLWDRARTASSVLLHRYRHLHSGKACLARTRLEAAYLTCEANPGCGASFKLNGGMRCFEARKNGVFFGRHHLRRGNHRQRPGGLHRCNSRRPTWP